jgi:hypothetical protein
MDKAAIENRLYELVDAPWVKFVKRIVVGNVNALVIATWACAAAMTYFAASEFVDRINGPCTCLGLCESSLKNFSGLLVTSAALLILTIVSFVHLFKNINVSTTPNSISVCAPLLVAVVISAVLLSIFNNAPLAIQTPSDCYVKADEMTEMLRVIYINQDNLICPQLNQPRISI